MQILTLAPAFIAGLGLGLFYFGGLWLTIQRLTTTRKPYHLILASFLFRLTVCLVGFYLILSSKGEQQLISLLACVLGFLLIRTILIRRLGLL